MPITKVTFLEDRVRFYYFLKKPWGFDDVKDTIDVLYESINKLPKMPKEKQFFGCGIEEFFIPNCNKTIVFLFNKYMEKSAGPMEEDMYGPYLKDNT